MTSATEGSIGPEPEFRARQADLGQAGADRRLAGDEGRAAGRAALLAVPVGEDRAFLADAVDVGRAVAHDAHVVGADIEPADVVAHDEQDVRLAACRLRLRGPDRRRGRERSSGGGDCAVPPSSTLRRLSETSLVTAGSCRRAVPDRRS